MPRFQGDIQKVYQGEYWTNRYIILAASLAEAHAATARIVEHEKAIYPANIIVESYRTSDMEPQTDVYAKTVINDPGDLSSVTDLMPLFDVVRVDFSTGSGRPSRKYLRGVLFDAAVSGMQIISSHLTLIGVSYGTELLNESMFVDVDSQVFTEFTVFPAVHMRQLRRGSRRAPII